jgi:hypothetical protein
LGAAALHHEAENQDRDVLFQSPHSPMGVCFLIEVFENR